MPRKSKQAISSASLAEGTTLGNTCFHLFFSFFKVLQNKMQRPITLTEKSFVRHFTSLSDDIQGGKAVFSVLPTSDVFQLLFFLLSILRKTFYLIIFLHTLGQNVNYKRRVDLPSGNTTSNVSNFSGLNDKNLICFIVPTAPHHHYTMKLVTPVVFSEKVFSYQSSLCLTHKRHALALGS